MSIRKHFFCHFSRASFIALLLALTQPSGAQIQSASLAQQRLLLKLAFAHTNVVRVNQIDMDSALRFACRGTRLNAMVLITENFDDLVKTENGYRFLAGKESIGDMERLASACKGKERARMHALVGYYYAYQPGTTKNDLDKALTYLTRAEKEAAAWNDDKTVCHVLYGKMKCYLDYGEVDLARKAYDEAIRVAQKIHDRLEEALARYYWGTYSPFSPSTLNDRIRTLAQADSLFTIIDRTDQRINVFMNMSYLCFAAGRVEDSKRYARESLARQQIIGFPFTHYTNDMLAFLEGAQENDAVSLELSLKTIEGVERTGDSTGYGYFCYRVASFYAKHAGTIAHWPFKEEAIKAIDWYQKAIRMFENTGDPTAYACVDGISNMLRHMNKNEERITLSQSILAKIPTRDPLRLRDIHLNLAAAHMDLGRASEAEAYLHKAEAFQHESSARSGDIRLGDFYHSAGLIYAKLGQFRRGRFYLEKYLNEPVMKGLNGVAEAELALARLDSLNGDFRNAYRHLSAYRMAFKDVTTAVQAELVRELQIRYETERKDNNIRILEQQSALHEGKAREEQFAKQVVIAFATLLVLFLMVLYNRFRIKQRTNKQLTEQQDVITRKNEALAQLVDEKEWLLKEVHHRVKNNLQIVMSLLNTQANYLDNEAAMQAIQESQERMYAISLIHQKLYRSQKSSLINIREYVDELVEHIAGGLSHNKRVTFSINIGELSLDASQAVLC
ncbi:sensor histidine kinase [Dawidia soli]|uniref:histidine kinase n=1 Tax=Dawidia soli TaxID=2782352 RepID=A0AAP2GGM8_9BACT|nr:histidine kinase dimerization/phosphoacceptor domain -containing protein [Dawidia soli]MBT1686301.1 hypothetical protein [Dawidia soli]